MTLGLVLTMVIGYSITVVLATIGFAAVVVSLVKTTTDSYHAFLGGIGFLLLSFLMSLVTHLFTS